jgi:predicted TIM-barrel fold metal-dependent hydrolase
MEPFWFPWLIGMPCETTIGICSLLLGGVLEKYPDLKICFAHGGGSFPYTLGRIEHGFDVGYSFDRDAVVVDDSSHGIKKKVSSGFSCREM